MDFGNFVGDIVAARMIIVKLSYHQGLIYDAIDEAKNMFYFLENAFRHGYVFENFVRSVIDEIPTVVLKNLTQDHFEALENINKMLNEYVEHA